MQKGVRDAFATFFEDPSLVTLRTVLKEHTGETDNLDFKQAWYSYDKIARSVLALGNSGGGCIVFGVQQGPDNSFTSVGLSELHDKSQVTQSIRKFLPRQLEWNVLDFCYTESEYPTIKGKKFQVLFVIDTCEYIPFVSCADGADIKKNTIYTRVGTSSEPADYVAIQKMINRRIESKYDSTNELDMEIHLTQLRTLYRMIPRYLPPALFPSIEEMVGRSNPAYPAQDFDSFVSQLIERKKAIIARMVE